MGLLDRVKETAGGVVATAQDGLSKSQAKHQAEEMFKVLGQAYFAHHCGRATLDEVDALAAGMRKRMEPIEQQLGPVPFPQPLPEPPPPALLPGPPVADVVDVTDAEAPTTAQAAPATTQAPAAAQERLAGYEPTTARGYEPTRAEAPAWRPPPAPEPTATTTRLDPSTAWQPPPVPPAPEATAHLDARKGWPAPAGHHDGATSAYPTAPRAAQHDATRRDAVQQHEVQQHEVQQHRAQPDETTAFDPTTGWPLPDPEEERTWFDAWPADDSR